MPFLLPNFPDFWTYFSKFEFPALYKVLRVHFPGLDSIESTQTRLELEKIRVESGLDPPLMSIPTQNISDQKEEEALLLKV